MTPPPLAAPPSCAVLWSYVGQYTTLSRRALNSCIRVGARRKARIQPRTENVVPPRSQTALRGTPDTTKNAPLFRVLPHIVR